MSAEIQDIAVIVPCPHCGKRVEVDISHMTKPRPIRPIRPEDDKR